MDYGSLFGGAASEFTDQVNKRESSALALKLQSAKLEQEHQARTAEAAQQAQLEKDRFDKENMASPEVSSGLANTYKKVTGTDMPLQPGQRMTNAEMTNVSGTLQTLMSPGQHQFTASNLIEKDRTRGFPMGMYDKNADGAIQGGLHVLPGYEDNKKQYDNFNQVWSNTQRSHELYKQLAVNGSVAKVLGAVPFVPQELKPTMSELSRLRDSTSILYGETADHLPGGRASLGLGEKASSYMIGADVPPDQEQNIYDNTGYQLYRGFKLIHPDAIPPADLQQKYGWISQHPGGVNSGGVPINGSFHNGSFFVQTAKGDSVMIPSPQEAVGSAKGINDAQSGQDEAQSAARFFAAKHAAQQTKGRK